MVRPAIFAFVAALFGALTVDAISCWDQRGSGGVSCVASPAVPCPRGYRPVFYDDPYPCHEYEFTPVAVTIRLELSSTHFRA
ncbi:MAG: hypothetical protein J3Q66DRAFT_438376 [Benniella sp.]|nr:MAG: hypothetical protein J3Q66DRAFT_438376 [Benniella sp.]